MLFLKGGLKVVVSFCFSVSIAQVDALIPLERATRFCSAGVPRQSSWGQHFGDLFNFGCFPGRWKELGVCLLFCIHLCLLFFIGLLEVRSLLHPELQQWDRGNVGRWRVAEWIHPLLAFCFAQGSIRSSIVGGSNWSSRRKGPSEKVQLPCETCCCPGLGETAAEAQQRSGRATVGGHVEIDLSVALWGTDFFLSESGGNALWM